jgi:hypothetical protein
MVHEREEEMYELKTKINDASVEKFLKAIPEDKKRQDSFAILDMMKEVTGEEPKMWGTSIIGFGTYRYKYASGQEGDWLRIGFSPRKQNLSLYIMSGFQQNEELMAKLGKYSTGKGCLYIKRLEDIDQSVLKELIKASFTATKKFER